MACSEVGGEHLHFPSAARLAVLGHWPTQQCYGDEVTAPSLGLQESNMHHTSHSRHVPRPVGGGACQTPGRGRRGKALVIRGVGLTRHLGPAQVIRLAPSDHSASGASSIPTATCGTCLHSPSLLPLGPSDQAWPPKLMVWRQLWGPVSLPSVLPAILPAVPQAPSDTY